MDTVLEERGPGRLMVPDIMMGGNGEGVSDPLSRRGLHGLPAEAVGVGHRGWGMGGWKALDVTSKTSMEKEMWELGACQNSPGVSKG